tara:strand:- start:1201 stop:1410 length:210 start_codon:yes stop_codon:yes gene_type:complete
MSRGTDIKEAKLGKILRELVVNIGINDVISRVMLDLEKLELKSKHTLKIDLQLRNLVIQSKKLNISAKA